MSDDLNVFSFRFYAPDLAIAEELRRNFLNDPAFVYKGMIGLMTRDFKMLGALKLSEEDELFE
jgi:hypothetical protein